MYFNIISDYKMLMHFYYKKQACGLAFPYIYNSTSSWGSITMLKCEGGNFLIAVENQML